MMYETRYDNFPSSKDMSLRKKFHQQKLFCDVLEEIDSKLASGKVLYYLPSTMTYETEKELVGFLQEKGYYVKVDTGKRLIVKIKEDN